jgi:hypothetical protein
MTETDDLLIDNANKQPINHFFGYYFTFFPRVIGAFLMFLGVVLVLLLNALFFVIGILFFIIGAYLLTGAHGVQIDIVNKQFREYNSILSWKRGEWIPLQKYPYLTILKANTSIRSSDITGVNTSTQTISALGIYLLSETHRNRHLIYKSSHGSSHIHQKAADLAYLLQKEVVRFQPKRISYRK